MPPDAEGHITSCDLALLVRRGISELADPARAPAMQAYMRSDTP